MFMVFVLSLTLMLQAFLRGRGSPDGCQTYFLRLLGRLILVRPNLIRALFICTKNKLRSPTAEQVFSTWPGVETDSAGLASDACVQLSSEQLEWATIIFVMEKIHTSKLKQKFKLYLNDKKIVCLNIPDNFRYMQPELVEVLEKRVGQSLR